MGLVKGIFTRFLVWLDSFLNPVVLIAIGAIVSIVMIVVVIVMKIKGDF